MDSTQSSRLQPQINHLRRKGALLQKRLREYTEEIRTDGRPIGALRPIFFFGLIFTTGALLLYAAAFYLNYITFSAMGLASIELALVVTLAAFLNFELGLRSYGAWYYGDDWKYLPLFIISGLVGVLLVVGQIFLGYIRGDIVEDALFVSPGMISFLFPLFAVGVELAGCIAFHEGVHNLLTSGRTIWLHQKIQRGEKTLLELANEIDRLKADLEITEAEAQGEDSLQELDYKRTILKRIAITLIATTIILVAVGISVARASECRVILLDLSKSSEATDQSQMGSEFEKNIAATLKIIRGIDSGGSVTFIGITDQSFSNPMILLDRELPDNPGLFGEKMEFEKKRMVKEFKKIAGSLRPSYNRTDIFGAVALAKKYFRETCQEKRLYILSDMRHTSGGINMEDVPMVSQDWIKKLERKGVIPRLNDTKVYVMGVHPIGKDAPYMENLERFWRAYFAKAGADLKTFTILREVTK